MAAKMVSLRLDEELLDWATTYAESRGVTRTALLESAVASFKDDCECGVPDVRAMAESQAAMRQTALNALQGVGDCPDRPGELGHIWKSAKDDSRRSCRFCGMPGRDGIRREPGKPDVHETGGFFGKATGERAELFSRLRAPDSVRGIKPKEKS